MDIACKEQGKTITDEFHSSLMGMNRNDSKRKIQEEFGSDFNIDLFYKRVGEINHEIMKKGIPLMKGAKELLDFCKQENIKTCIGTSTNKIAAFDLLEADKLLDYFDYILCGDEITKGKPDPEIYIKCFEKFDFKKEEALIFEDANPGAVAALEAGIRLVLVPDLAYLSKESKDKAFKVLNDLSEIIDVIKEENERTPSI